ncbi:hypothetical protein KM043_010407 [Ampulex compressa]|nr:hypothetical protein KM043_010407 [Ampulex compressa]
MVASFRTDSPSRLRSRFSRAARGSSGQEWGSRASMIRGGGLDGGNDGERGSASGGRTAVLNGVRSTTVRRFGRFIAKHGSERLVYRSREHPRLERGKTWTGGWRSTINDPAEFAALFLRKAGGYFCPSFPVLLGL